MSIDPMDFPDGYYAAPDPNDQGIITCWRRRSTRKSASFGPWKRGASYIHGPKRADIPQDPAERIAFIKAHLAANEEWCQRVYAVIAADLDAARLLFASFTGSCSSCGRALTDPTSKLLGIGPECRSRKAVAA